MVKSGVYWKDFYDSQVLSLLDVCALFFTLIVTAILFIRSVNLLFCKKDHDHDKQVTGSSRRSNSNVSSQMKEGDFEMNSIKGHGNSVGNMSMSFSSNTIDVVKLELERKQKSKVQRRKAIKRTHIVSKLLLISSLIFSIIVLFYSLIAAILILFFNIKNLGCGDRAIIAIFYSLQRFSLTLFFISRLFLSFRGSVLEIKLCFILFFSITSFLTYILTGIYYVYTAYVEGSSGNNGYYCNVSKLVLPLGVAYIVDVLWTIFLSAIFFYKIKQVKFEQILCKM